MSKRLIFGLGNHGYIYRNNKHNIGQILADKLAERLKLSFTKNSNISAEICTTDRVIIAKSMGYINNSGVALHRIAKYYKIPSENILLFHDDIDLKPGVICMKISGGSGGHNGIINIYDNMTPNIWRIRIGVGRPVHKYEVVDYVLNDPSVEDQISINLALDFLLDLSIEQEEFIKLLPIINSYKQAKASVWNN